MRAFVSGAGGFIGSHLCEVLRDAGHAVTGMAHARGQDSFGWLDEVDGITKCRGDVRDAEQMRALIKGHDVVFHLAALISVPDSYERPRSYMETNVGGTLNILLACREHGAKLIHTSTSEVYGSAQYTPMDEKHPISPQSPYAASKVAADALVQSFRLSYGMDCVTLRPFNTYGPRQSERAVIARIIRQTLDPGANEIVLGCLTSERDFTYVADTARAFLAALRAEPGVYNAGTGHAVSILALARLVSSAKPIFQVPGRLRPEASEVTALCAKTTKLHKATRWAATTELGKGLALTRAWHEQRMGFSGDLDLVA